MVYTLLIWMIVLGGDLVCCAAFSDDNYCSYWGTNCRLFKKQADSFNHYCEKDHELWR